MLKTCRSPDLRYRPRRNRRSPAIRSLCQEARLHPSDLIYPQFITEGKGSRDPIISMPGIYRLSIDLLLYEAEQILKLGIPALALFPVISSELKDDEGSEGVNSHGLLQEAIRAVKNEFPQLCVITDVALDPYTSHGHDGLVGKNGEILNDSTLDVLVKMALIQAEAGVDMVAPSDMMDGRVGVIRQALDQAGFERVGILAYSAKYASAFYGPFRDALSSSPKFGDKKSYQMNPANAREALLEIALDEIEGADIVMVKPALPYLDIISKVREATMLPVSAYQVSGEYSMVMAAAQKGWIDEKKVFWESLVGIKRAGADMIFSYAAPLVARLINSEQY